ncbi:GON-4-like protein [Pelodytes ibericus]
MCSIEEQDCEDGQQRRKKRMAGKRTRESWKEDNEAAVSSDLDNSLDRNLEDRAKQHNLTVVNVRNILHEVITNEHVVAMMKAAITETQSLPFFEPKMTRSKLKEVVEKGVVIPTWNLSPIKKVGELKAPQFVDIHLAEEDSSDEEYRPEEEEEDETAEESLLESDVDSTASSPCGQIHPGQCHPPESAEEEPVDCRPASERHAEPAPMGPPPPPKAKSTQDSTFMEELHAVDEELNRGTMCMESFQSLDDSLIAFRTRSKRPLKDVRIGQLEAKLKAPDITPDMYDPNTADDEDWKMWLCSLMHDDEGNEDEADDDDDDDPEYNILEDLDEPDTEDLRNDRAVRITKKEVSELMEELFETFQDEMGFSHLEEDGKEDEDHTEEALPDFNTPQAIRFEEPLANFLSEQHRTVKAQLEFLRMRKSMLKPPIPEAEESNPPNTREDTAPKGPPIFALDAGQRKRLQQQIQQHVQLLTQVHLLTCRNPRLSEEAHTTRIFLIELSGFSENSVQTHCPGNPDFQSTFQACNLTDALQLLPIFHSQFPENKEPPKLQIKGTSEVSSLPMDVAWIMATQPIFMYPELLPISALKAKGHRDRVFFSKAEDSLLTLGLKHFEGTEYTKALISKYLVTAKTAQQLTAHIKNLTMDKSPDNIIKFYNRTKLLPAAVMARCCEDVQPYDNKPPVEREKHRLPCWLKANQSSIEAEMEKLERDASAGKPTSKYPLLLPPELALKPLSNRFYRKVSRQRRRQPLKPLLIRPSSGGVNKPAVKPSVLQPLPLRILGPVPPFLQSAVPVKGIMGVNSVNMLGGSHAIVTQVPSPKPKMMVPALTSHRARRPLLGALSKRKTLPKNPSYQAPALVHSAPVIFAVPNGALKLSLGSSCSVIQPVTSRAAIPVTTVLLHASPIPVTQTLLPPPFSQTLINIPAVFPGEQRSSIAEGEVKKKELEATAQEWDCLSITIKVEQDGGPQENGMGDGKGFAVEEERHECSEVLPALVEDIGDPGPEEEDVRSVMVASPPVSPELRSKSDAVQILHTVEWSEGGVDVDRSSHTYIRMKVLADPAEPVDTKDPENEKKCGQQSPLKGQETTGTAAGQEQSPKNASSTDGDVDMSSPADPQHEISSPLCQQEGAHDKEGPEEEEEEEDFDDLTQDEDEEMSSASEESVLSVPELQETMEKLTWLASERRLSQEGDSEENSQEENSEQEEEEEEEGEEGTESSLQKDEEMTDEVTANSSKKAVPSHPHIPSPVPKETTTAPVGETRRGGNKGRSSHRVRSRRGRPRTSKDASKLLHLYDENILLKDPLREQKDMAFAQEYLNRVREALQLLPGKYDQFLHLIYQFETSRHTSTAVDLYENLRDLLHDWPQLLKDFAAFLLPEQALECGLFQEQQAFDKSRKFLRQLEICFLENPAQHQKIIKLLQSCAECPLQEVSKLKAQMWQLLKGHNHLQDEFSLFFDQLRPPASRLGEFEVVNWTEDKEYKFDGFEEITLPDIEEEEETSKIHPQQRTKKRKEVTQAQEVDWLDGGKDCPCPCHEGEQRLKRCKRRICNHCSSKSCEMRSHKTRETLELTTGGPPSLGNCEHKLSAGGRAVFRGSSIPDTATKPRTGYRKTRPQTKDLPRPVFAQKSARKSMSVKGPDQASEKAFPSSLPGTIPPSPTPSPMPAGDDNVDVVECLPSSSPEIMSSVSATCPLPHYNKDVTAQQLTGTITKEEQTLTVCAKNITVSSSGEKVILWTREADRVILTMCQDRGAHDETFVAISLKLGNKSPVEVSQRFRELVNLFQTACVTSSDEDEEAETMADQEAPLSEEDADD